MILIFFFINCTFETVLLLQKTIRYVDRDPKDY